MAVMYYAAMISHLGLIRIFLRKPSTKTRVAKNFEANEKTPEFYCDSQHRYELSTKTARRSILRSEITT